MTDPNETLCVWCGKPCGRDRVVNRQLGVFCSRTHERHKQDENYAYWDAHDRIRPQRWRYSTGT